jgi:hypothetical protein
MRYIRVDSSYFSFENNKVVYIAKRDMMNYTSYERADISTTV